MLGDEREIEPWLHFRDQECLDGENVMMSLTVYEWDRYEIMERLMGLPISQGKFAVTKRLSGQLLEFPASGKFTVSDPVDCGTDVKQMATWIHPEIHSERSSHLRECEIVGKQSLFDESLS